jgi:para-aminobenzoate N-oxygenase AurF
MPTGAPSGPLDQWYETAGVRRGIRRDLREQSGDGKVFFPDRLVPHLAHPLVAALGEEAREKLRLLHLYQFLLATTHMETRVVNVGAEWIANGRLGLDLPAAMRMDAFKVYCDEGYHALYSLDLADQIAHATGVPLPSWDYGGFVDRLRRRGGQLLPEHPELAHLLQVVVFETLITAVLNEAPAEPELDETVREVLRDHARDEGRHHRFFSVFFHELWAGLDTSLRPPVAKALPELIRLCIVADSVPVRSALRSVGLGGEAADEVVAQCYGTSENRARLAEITRATVSMCRSAGVFDTPGAADEFAAQGLVSGVSC